MLKDEKIADIEKEYNEKNLILEQFGDWVNGVTLYEDMFGDLEMIMPVVFIDEEETKHMVKMTIYDALEYAESRNDILLGGSTYFKGFVSKDTTKDIHAFIIDMDNVYSGVLLHALQNDWNTDDEKLPKPTYIVNSGTGLHLYFLFNEPIPRYKCNALNIDRLYRNLAEQQTTKRIYLQRQVQWYGQDFRMAGSLNKYNWRNEVFRVGEKWDIEELAAAVGMKDIHFVRYSETRNVKPIRRKQTRKSQKRHGWKCNRGFYDYTLERCRRETKEGTRYMSFCALSVIAWKCNVPINEVERDLLGLIPTYNEGAVRKIKDKEVQHALRMYNERAMLTQRDRLQDWIGWEYKPMKRNGLKREQHLYLARRRKEDMKVINLPMKHPEGRPNAEQIVRKWCESNPEETKAACIRETGLSKPTVYRWWKA